MSSKPFKVLTKIFINKLLTESQVIYIQKNIDKILSLFSFMKYSRMQSAKLSNPFVAGKYGLEIGGPSFIFSMKGDFPIYPFVTKLDNVNFSAETVWDGSICEGLTFQYDQKHSLGYQFLREATNLEGIPNNQYDFILSSHTLEHIANPLKALEEWLRVLKLFGVLILVVPHKDGTFDHHRQLTPFAHLLDDYHRCTGEDDLSHLPEILALHDLSMDPAAGPFEDFKKRSEKNFEHRCLHHHVFNTDLVIDLMNFFNLQILAVEARKPYDIIAIGQKVPPSQLTNKHDFTYKSPFQSDRFVQN